MKIGDKQAFPLGDYTHGGENGMTYREWLIGQALAANCVVESASEAAADAVAIADAVLARLEAEKEPKP